MVNISKFLVTTLTKTARRYLVGPEQRWVFERPPTGWVPSLIERTSLYLHVPFCRHMCPYCPYTKVPYQDSLIEPYTQAAIAEVDAWANAVGPTEITSIYTGGGTPTLALNSVAHILERVRDRFHLTGDICIETNPADVDAETAQRLHDMGVTLVSLGIQSFRPESLQVLGRDYNPKAAERALSLLAKSNFASVNADLMFALPGQPLSSVIEDLAHAAELGADQVTTYPLFTFPYTSVGQYRQLVAVRMPALKARRMQYRAIHQWCAGNGFERVSVWGFKRGSVPRYSSVTRDSYIGIGPGAGSHLSDGFVLNSFDLNSWQASLSRGVLPVSLRMPFTAQMAGWWWLYWQFYDTRIPMAHLDAMLGPDAGKVRRWLKLVKILGFAVRSGEVLELTEPGAFWMHLLQNYFALNYVNTLWTQARRQPWPEEVRI